MLYSLDNEKPNIGKNVFIAESADIVGNVHIGNESGIWFNAVIRADYGKIVIGKRTNIQDLCVLHVDDKHSLTIGNDVTIGHKAILHGCTIGNRALIGMGATVMSGAVIGNEAIVGAGALVTEGTVIPAKSLAIGSPAKVVKKLSKEHIEGLTKSANVYVENAKRFLEKLQKIG